MIEPKYKITDKILNSIVRYEIERKGIIDIEKTDDTKHELRLDANAKDLFYLGNILGLEFTLKEAKRISSGKNIGELNKRENYLINFRNAIEYILATQTSYFPVQTNLLIHLNKIIIKDVADDWDSKYRVEGDKIDEAENDWIDLMDRNFSVNELQTQAQKGLEWFASNQNRVHPFIRIPYVVYILIRTMPFLRANKITILAVCKYLFYKSKMNINGYLPTVKVFAVYKKELYEALKQSMEYNDDITSFIEVFSSSYAKEIKDLKGTLNEVVEKGKEKKQQPFLDLNKRQLKILRYLQNIPQVKREEYIEIMDVSTMTAYRDLNQLVKKGLLRLEGKGRGTKYMLASK